MLQCVDSVLQCVAGCFARNLLMLPQVVCVLQYVAKRSMLHFFGLKVARVEHFESRCACIAT